MGSQVLDPDLREAIDRLSAGLDAVFAAGLTPRDARDAVMVIRDLEAQGRRMDAAQVTLLAEIDREKWFRPDGHASAKVMVRHIGHLSESEAKRRASVARALRDLPEVSARFEAGRIGFCQAQRIARAYANKRVRAALVRKDRTLAQLAERESFMDFDLRLTEWVRRVDEDGTADTNQRNHENRDLKILLDYDGSWSIVGGCASLQGVKLKDIHEHFVKAEFLADWAEARDRLGEAATGDDLVRTDAQRRMDAFTAIFEQAAGALVAAGGSPIVTNIVMDLATFERTAKLFAGAEPGPVDDALDDEYDDQSDDWCSQLFGPDNDLSGFGDESLSNDDLSGAVGDPPSHDARPDQPNDDDLSSPEAGGRRADDLDRPHDGGDATRSKADRPPRSDGPSRRELGNLRPSSGCEAGTVGGWSHGVGYRCSTLNGTPVDAREAVAAALIGHIRRVVTGADGVVINLGRLRRTYTGSAQLAARLSSMFCNWPGCNVAVTQCQTDHRTPWADRGGGGGRTDQCNALTLCGRHNRYKECGFDVTRDDSGQLRILRLDGTELP